MASIRKALPVEAQIANDPVFGEGQRFALGGSEKSIVEFFPSSQVVRVTSHFAHIVLYGANEPQSSPEGITIERGDTTLGLTPQGRVAIIHAFRDTPACAPSPSEDAPVQDQTSEQPGHGTSQEQKERLTVLGRVGATPSFRTTPKGTLIARFPVAVHVGENKTIWHTVLAFGERAEKLKESLNKGEQVEVVGYRHFREATTRDGRSKTVEELYAVVVKNR